MWKRSIGIVRHGPQARGIYEAHKICLNNETLLKDHCFTYHPGMMIPGLLESHKVIILNDELFLKAQGTMQFKYY